VPIIGDAGNVLGDLLQVFKAGEEARHQGVVAGDCRVARA
jgi:hypothetical protein